MKEALSIVAAVLIALCTVPYLIDTARKITKPNIVTWTTWTLLTGIATAAIFSAHEPRAGLLTLGSAISTGLVVLLGFRHGFAKYSLFDGLCQAGVIIGFILWLIFNSPTIAIIAAVSIDFTAMLPTLKHSWQKPQEETWQTYVISSAAAILTIISLTSYSIASLAYPIYLVLGDALVAAVIVYRRERKRLTLAR